MSSRLVKLWGTLTCLAVVVCIGWAMALPASGNVACSARQAKRDVVKARLHYIETKRVYRATVTYSELYSPGVGRWVRLARKAGYTWSEMPTLMRVIDRESEGNAGVPNIEGSGALGLLQVMPEWSNGSKVDYWKQWNLPAKWDRTDPWETLRHTVHMSWTNWGE